jgi:ABC-type oligopeptide transport system ATPase subunit
MTATLVAKNVAGGFAHRTLFEGLDVTVAPGDVVGVVGANGAGNSTLLRILAGDLESLDGAVSIAPADAFVGWLPQGHERVRRLPDPHPKDSDPSLPKPRALTLSGAAFAPLSLTIAPWFAAPTTGVAQQPR